MSEFGNWAMECIILVTESVQAELSGAGDLSISRFGYRPCAVVLSLQISQCHITVMCICKDSYVSLCGLGNVKNMIEIEGIDLFSMQG